MSKPKPPTDPRDRRHHGASDAARNAVCSRAREAPARAADAAHSAGAGRDARGRLMPIIELPFTAGTVRVTVERVMVMGGAEV